LRIGELFWPRWPSVDLERRVVDVVEFASALGYELRESSGKSRDAVVEVGRPHGMEGGGTRPTLRPSR
jgi:hypothetical protein